MNKFKLHVAASAIAALLLVPADVAVVRADDDDWEDRWEDYWDDYEDALEEAREEAEERWEEERDAMRRLRERGIILGGSGWHHYPHHGAYRPYHEPGLRSHRFYDSYCPHRLGYLPYHRYRGGVHAGPVRVYYGPSGAVRVGPIHVYWD